LLLQGYTASTEDIRTVNVSKEEQVFKCESCGNVVIVKEIGGELFCCGKPMNLENK